MHVDGHQDKTALFVGDVSETFTHAIDDLKLHWQTYLADYLKEMRND
jgi:hypothetical protein